MSSNANQYRLFGTPFSLYTGKARSYLYKKGIPFEEIHSTLRVYQKFIIPRTGVRFVPVVQTPDDQVLQDTTVIIDELESQFPERSVYPITPKQRLVSLLLEVYGDEWLVIPAMHYRWNFDAVNQPFIYQQFGTVISPKLPKLVRGWLGKKLGDKFRGFVPMLGINQQTIPAIEQSYTALLADLNTHFEAHEYLLGSQPSIGDFGLIGPVYAHLYHDPYPGELMRQTAPAVAAWVERMISKEPVSGSFLAKDEIPDSLLPVLQRMASEQLPTLMQIDGRLTQWRKENPNAAIPRSIGEGDFTIEGVTGQRMMMPYSLWMFQRAVEFYQSQSQEVQSELDPFLQALGFGESLKNGLANSLARVNNKLRFAD